MYLTSYEKIAGLPIGYGRISPGHLSIFLIYILQGIEAF